MGDSERELDSPVVPARSDVYSSHDVYIVCVCLVCVCARVYVFFTSSGLDADRPFSAGVFPPSTSTPLVEATVTHTPVLWLQFFGGDIFCIVSFFVSAQHLASVLGTWALGHLGRQTATRDGKFRTLTYIVR